MFADLSLEHQILKDIDENKALKPAVLREFVDYAMETHGASQRLVCRAVGIS